MVNRIRFMRGIIAGWRHLGQLVFCFLENGILWLFGAMGSLAPPLPGRAGEVGYMYREKLRQLAICMESAVENLFRETGFSQHMKNREGQRRTHHGCGERASAARETTHHSM